MRCREPERCLLSLSLTRTAIRKRHEACREFKAAINCRNPKYFKAVRGRTALQKGETYSTQNDEHTSGNAFLIEVFVLLHCIHIHNRDSQTSVLHETWTDK